MQEHISTRLKELRDEFQRGQSELHALQARVEEVRELLLRISGAVQVLEELQELLDAPTGEGSAPGEQLSHLHNAPGPN